MNDRASSRTTLGNHPSRALRLARALAAPGLNFAMEAHNGLSAKLAERAGFEILWASGLSIATAMGLRDSNEASWTQLVDAVEIMADATDAPILVDGDTGFGDFNNARRFARKLEAVGAAGVCIEDKVFPKSNSFRSDPGNLADPIEFSGRIAAIRDHVLDKDFSVVARTEAIICGQSVDEALRRCAMYREAGADAVLVHSKRKDASEVLAFMNGWGSICPVVVVPTTYSSTPTSELEESGVSLAIWANHAIRASYMAIANTYCQIAQQRSIQSVEHSIASIEDIFELMDYDELTRSGVTYNAIRGVS